MDCELDESTGELSPENFVISGNANGSDVMMRDRKSVPPIPELDNLGKDSFKEEDPGPEMTSNVESKKLSNCREENKDNLADENPLISHTMDETDNSDFVVQDVKVCDICGDGGREDLLAICCRCSDGAEHTYCMREMLEKVPEGDWMCEECRYEEEMKNQRQHKVELEKTSSKVSRGISNARLKSDTWIANDLGIASKDHSNMKILGKRLKEDAEVSSVSKRQAVESVNHSPKTTGSFSKSNSFSSLNANPKVNFSDEAIPLKQKSDREPPPFAIKERIGKSYGRSMSFRDMSSGRYGNRESKVKMLSPELIHNQDNKGFKHIKERSVLERKSSFKSERSGFSSQRAKCCPVDGLPDFATSKSLREETNGSNHLKAAIEAAMLRKPGICRKPRAADLSNGSSHGSKNIDMVSKKNVYSGLAKDVITSVQSCRHSSLDNVETSTSITGDGDLVAPYDGKASIRDLPFQLPSPKSVLWRSWAIPEDEFIWQGNFEVHKENNVECCDGVQAHLSSCASPRIHSVVDKFPHKVVLNEVPRLSTWPLQFQEYGVKEDNVALYFFAKDVDSYERGYKILLEMMIKKDLALKGIINGVELMIFPSTQLPQQSQRWNMLHFLWGVFRGKKTGRPYQVCSFVSGDAFVEKTTSSKWGHTERFFLQDDTPANHIGAAEESMPGKTHPSENQVLVESPNLDLGFRG